MRMYFAALVLPDDLNQEIKLFKNLMLERWGCKVGLRSPAHITLIPPFRMDGTMEEHFANDLNAWCKNIAPFPVATNNFSAFRPRTIFIEPVLDEPLKKLKRSIDTFSKTHTQYGAKTDTRPFHPHITIATRDLHKRAFAEAWPLFEHKEFKGHFEATGLSVLRHNTVNWDVIHTAPFAFKQNTTY
jgi:2'-5' RNA ligase